MRITPALTFALIFYLTLGSIVGEPNLLDASAITAEVFAIFTYTANFFAGYHGATALGWHWSLAAEEQFYFVFPFFIVLFPRTKTRFWITLSCIALISFLVRPYGGKWFGEAPAAMYLPQFRNDALGYGFLVFIAQQQPWFKALAPRVLIENFFIRSPTIIFLLGIIALAPQMALNFNYAIPIIGCASALALLIAIWAEHPLISFSPISKIFNWVGLRSYGLYLLHIPVVRIVQHVEGKYFSNSGAISYSVHFLAVVICLVVMVEISFQFIEKPMMKLGKNWSNEILIGM
jgi:peptidoglycan/LPS O-acetylase OafA/YrhL